MALYSNLNRSLYCYLRAVGSIFPKYYIRNMHEKVITLEIGALDNFTSQLMQRQTDKWNPHRNAKKSISAINTNIDNRSDHGNMEQLDIKRINNIFQELIEVGDNSELLYLITECIKYRKCPSLSNLIYVLTYCAQNGDKAMIHQIKSLYEEFYPDDLKLNSNFDHYLAEAIWVKGNISESLKIFRKVYDENAYLRRRIRLTFKILVADAVSNRSEAALVNIVNFSKELISDYKDFFPLMCIWEVCFLSEWYTNQCVALDLLEDSKGLLNAVINRIPYVVSVSLSSQRTEMIYRLLEILLKYDMKSQYTGVLLALLNYQVHQGDIRSCLEIVQWSAKYNVKLPTIHHEKFLNVLLNCNVMVHKQETSRKPKINDYEF